MWSYRYTTCWFLCSRRWCILRRWFSQLGIQAIGVLSVAVWVMGAAFILFKVLDKTIGLRVTADEELEGLDLSEHGMEGYAEFQLKNINSSRLKYKNIN